MSHQHENTKGNQGVFVFPCVLFRKSMVLRRHRRGISVRVIPEEMWMRNSGAASDESGCCVQRPPVRGEVELLRCVESPWLTQSQDVGYPSIRTGWEACIHARCAGVAVSRGDDRRGVATQDLGRGQQPRRARTKEQCVGSSSASFRVTESRFRFTLWSGRTLAGPWGTRRDVFGPRRPLCPSLELDFSGKINASSGGLGVRIVRAVGREFDGFGGL